MINMVAERFLSGPTYIASGASTHTVAQELDNLKRNESGFNHGAVVSSSDWQKTMALFTTVKPLLSQTN